MSILIQRHWQICCDGPEEDLLLNNLYEQGLKNFQASVFLCLKLPGKASNGSCQDQYACDR